MQLRIDSQFKQGGHSMMKKKQRFIDRWQDVVKPTTDSVTQEETMQLVRQACAMQLPGMINKNKRPIRYNHYCLGEKYKNIYFTTREYQTMSFLIRGMNVRMIADVLGLSKRTVEYFTRRMREKLNCKTTKSLIAVVKTTNFANYRPAVL
jgi:DNA-binding NarL/FixJ family response regulator